MRVAAAHSFRQQLESLRRTSAEALDAQRIASSGRRIERPSDDPAGFHRATLLDAMRSDLGASRKKMALARIELSSAEDALDGMGSALSRVRELAVAMSTGMMDADARGSAALEVGRIKETIVALGNTRYGEKSLFAGHQTGGAAFDATGAYLGDSAEQTVTVWAGTTVGITFAGDDVLRGASGGPDVIQILDDLQTALSINDVTGVQGSLAGLDSSLQHLLDLRADIGGRMSVIGSLDAHFESVEVSLIQDVATVRDADPIDAFSEVIRTRQAFESAMQVSVSSRTQSIFDLL